MNKYAKKLALVLAFTTTVATIEPTAVTAIAASKIVLTSGAAAPGTVYAGHSYSLKVAGTSVKFYSSNKAVASIGLTTGKLKPVKAGTVKVTAKSTKTGKAIAAKTFTVNQRATSVTTDSSELNLNAKGTAAIKAALAPVSSTDVVRFYSSDKKVATVGAKSGKVTAVADGTATIKVYAKATKATANKSKYNKVATVTVNVGACMDKAAQVSTTEVKALFKTDMKSYSLKASDFTITNDETKATVAVKSVSVSGKEVTLTTYASIADGKAYTVAYGKVSGQFTATDGKVSTLTIDPATVAYQTLTKVYAVAKDANGVVIKKYLYGDDSNNSGIDFTLTTSDGYISSEGLYLNSLTATAKANAVYHTYKYENGVEAGAITTGDVTITATSQSAISQNGVSYSLSKTAVNFSSSSYKQNTTIPCGITGMADEDNYKAYFKILDTAGTEISNYSAYTVSSSDSTVLIASGTIDNNTGVTVIGVKAGSAYLIVKNASTSAVVATLPVTVGTAAEASALSLGAASAVLSNTTSILDASSAVTADSKNISVTVKDQYGSSMTKTAADYTVECVSAPSSVTKSTVTEANGYFTKAANQITFAGENGGTAFTAGAYEYKVSYGTLIPQYITVTISAPDQAAKVQFRASVDTVTADSVVATADDISKSISVKTGAYQGALVKTFGIESAAADTTGIAVSKSTTDVYYFQSSKAALTNSSGTDVTEAYLDKENNKIKVTYLDSDGMTVRKMPAGTYTLTTKITYRIGTSETDLTTTSSITITITDTQPSLDVMLSENTVPASTKAEIAQAAYTVIYDGVTYGTNTSAGMFGVDESNTTLYGKNESGNTVAFSKITFLLPVPAGTTNQSAYYMTAIPVTSGLGSITLTAPLPATTGY